jgi:hypothetical protein
MCWAVVRHLGVQSVPISRFKKRSDAENMLQLMQRGLPIKCYEIVFDQGGWPDESTASH